MVLSCLKTALFRGRNRPISAVGNYLIRRNFGDFPDFFVGDNAGEELLILLLQMLESSLVVHLMLRLLLEKLQAGLVLFDDLRPGLDPYG